MSGCCSAEQFERLLAGQLSPAETHALEVHVEACPHCQERLARAASVAEPEWKRLNLSSREILSAADEGFLRQLREKPPATSRAAHETTEEDESANIQFPGPPTAKGPLGQLKSYHIRKQLGQGSYGVVYQAYDALDRLVAIKILKPEFAASPKERARFMEEARAGAAVKHDHVVTIYQIGDTPDFPLPYLVMEYIEGEPLSDQIHRKELLAPKEVARLVRQVALGVGAAHGQGMLHRDIKPANIMWEKATQRAKITDFGLACAFEENSARLPPSERLAGTLAYMCPELIVPPHRMDRRSDVYSLGVVLYELLTGERPFHGAKHMVLQHVVHEEPRPPRKLNDHVPRDLETITLKCLAKEPRRRYQTAQELAEELQRWLDDRPIQARPVPGWERAMKGMKRRPAVTALVWLLVLVTTLGFGLVTWQLHVAEKQREDAENQKQVAEDQKREADGHRRLAVGVMTRLSLELLERRDIGRGMSLLAHGLALTGEDTYLQRPILANLASWHSHLNSPSTVLHHPGSFNAAALHREGKILVTVGGDTSFHEEKQKGILQFWDTTTGKPIGKALEQESEIHAVAFSPDGARIVTGNAGGTAQVWDVATRRKHDSPLRYQRSDQQISAVAFSPDGETIVTGGDKGRVWLWDAATGQRRAPQSIMHNNRKVTAVAFSPDGTKILTGSVDETACLWKAASGEAIGEPLKHTGEVHAVAFSPDGETILTGGKNGVRRWKAATGGSLGFSPSQDVIKALAFREDGKSFQTASGNYQLNQLMIHILDTNTGKPRGRPLRYSGADHVIAFCPSGQTVLAGSRDGLARLWEVPPIRVDDNSPLKLFPHSRGLHAVAFSHDGKSVLTGCADGYAHRWDAATGEPSTFPLNHSEEVTAVAFSPNDRILLTGGKDGKVWRWDAATGQSIKPPLEHPNAVHAVAVSRDGQTILTGCADRKARLWDADTGKLRGELVWHRHAVHAVAFSPENKLALTGSEDRTAQLWDVATGKPLAISFRHGFRIQAVAFSPDGKTALTGGFDGIVRLWDVATGKLLEPSLRHQHAVHAVAFSPDGRTILTGAVNNHAYLWDAATGQPIGTSFAHGGSVRAVAFSPDGRTVLTGSWEDKKSQLKDKAAYLWPLPAPLAADTKGDVERIVLWVQVATGMEVDSAGGVRALSADEWHKRRQRLQELGGPPMP